MTKSALERASEAWGGVTLNNNDVVQPTNVHSLMFPTSIPAVRETPDYMTRTKALGYLIKLSECYVDKLNENGYLQFQAQDIYADDAIGVIIYGRESMLDLRTGTHKHQSQLKMRLRVNRVAGHDNFQNDDAVTVFERETFWADDFRTGVHGQPDGGMTIEKALVTFMLAEGITDNDELAQLWSHMPDGLKADECPEDGRYPALWAGQFDHSEVLLKNLQHMIDETRKDDGPRGLNPKIL